MKVTPENIEDIVTLCAHRFRSFGGGNVSPGNPISAALQSTPAQFAAGVDILEVVRYVIAAHEQIQSK